MSDDPMHDVLGQWTLTLEIRHLRQRGVETPEVDAKERTLERLRRQLAADAKRAATHELGNAA
jgi:hypothetical protein